ncbi:SDR family oxidoreductase [Nocardia asteroides]|uniref:SDR family NAD(P)-dependent oxidoreductase n=1 Tax=Nocardia asteroides TaxID=1824 RepID=UPI003413B6C2
MARLAGKVALVTGGSRGIGEGIVRRLAADGAAVVFTYHSGERAAKQLATQLRAEGADVRPARADSADADLLRETVRGVYLSHGHLDILVNNAGIGHFGAFSDITADQYDRVLAVNLGAVFHASQQALQHMDTGGRIITIGSVNADRNPIPGASIYALTKAGAAGFGSALAREVSHRGITVNTVQPGPIATDLNPAQGPFADILRPHIATGGYGNTADVAALVSFLAGPEADYITGATINIDGGFSI